MAPGTLPPLPYPSSALEPKIGRQTVEVHHDVLQANYVYAAAELLGQVESARGSTGVPDPLRQRTRATLARNLAFNQAGAELHRLYWENLCAEGHGDRPSQAFHAQICRDFRDPGGFAEEMTDVACGIPGDGWAILAWVPSLERLCVLGVQGHTDGWIPGAVPLLLFDVWEHAYFLQYPGNRSAYVRNIWKLINWNVVNARFADARSRS